MDITTICKDIEFLLGVVQTHRDRSGTGGVGREPAFCGHPLDGLFLATAFHDDVDNLKTQNMNGSSR